MASLTDIKNKISEYKKNYSLPSFELNISDWYKLFPNSRNKEQEKKCLQWPGIFPHAERQGVYLIFDKNKELLYIGKVSMNHNIGGRLGSYFSYAKDKINCKVNHEWSSNPEYIVTVAVPEGMSFEAPALEEYLIKNFSKSLPDNRIGTSS